MNLLKSLTVVLLLLATAITECTGNAEEAVALPGAEPYAPELVAKLRSAVEGKGEGYVPRTRHLEEDGSATYTNRLILESSPYLQQHAHNPVNWYPWGDEAFDTARRLGRPVLLSIGYSTCHWCHVMEEESFEDPEIAAYLNANYVAIKVDREERPDIDAIYMTAVRLSTGRGGWPMTTWLTPDAEPFFGGTYFPARDGDRGSRRGFLTLLRDLKAAYDEQPEAVAQRAGEISAKVRASMRPTGEQGLPGLDRIRPMMALSKTGFDADNGGRRGSPKFPSSLPLRLMLRYGDRTEDASYLDMVTLTLRKMADGGIHDQIGGGFHRYSTDAKWLVPHFEKMLYDNALLTVDYVEGFQAGGDPGFADVARDILDYVMREMTSSEGAFYSATDADSLNPAGEREEGWFFTWTPAEIGAVLDKETAALVMAYYNVSPEGNFEGRNILHRTRSAAELAAKRNLEPDETAARLEQASRQLYAARSKRPTPLLDDKVLAAWNGLMISAFARTGFVLDEPAYVAAAEHAASFILSRMVLDGRLQRSFNDGRARHNAYLEDYAFLIGGLLDLFEANAEVSWLRKAIALQETLDVHYLDREGGGYFRTSADHEDLLTREKPTGDGAIPSGNSVAALNLLRLYELTTDDAYRARADALFEALAGELRGATDLMLALEFRHGSPREIVIVTPSDDTEADPFLEVLRRRFLPHKVLIRAARGEDLKRQAETIPLLLGKVPRQGKATAYVCTAGVCGLPTSDPAEFEVQLADTPAESGESSE